MSPIDLSYGIRKRENKGKAKNNDQLLEYMCRVLKTSLCQPQSKLIMSQSAKIIIIVFFFFFFFFELEHKRPNKGILKNTSAERPRILTD